MFFLWLFSIVFSTISCFYIMIVSLSIRSLFISRYPIILCVYVYYCCKIFFVPLPKQNKQLKKKRFKAREYKQTIKEFNSFHKFHHTMIAMLSSQI